MSGPIGLMGNMVRVWLHDGPYKHAAHVARGQAPAPLLAVRVTEAG